MTPLCRRPPWSNPISAFLFLMVSAALPGAAQVFNITPLSVPTNASVYSMNNVGQMCGYVRLPNGDHHAFLWDSARGLRDLHTTDMGGPNSYAYDINDKGQVCGEYSTGEKDNRGYTIYRAFVWDPSNGYRDLGDLGGTGAKAVALNNKGQVCGYADTWNLNDFGNPIHHAFFWESAGGMRDLGALGMDPNRFGGDSEATDINDAGQVAGYSDTTDGGTTHAFLWDAARGMRDIGAPAGYDNAYVEAINAGGLVLAHAYPDTGDSDNFLWSAGAGWVKFEPRGWWTSAMNKNGHIAGSYDTEYKDADGYTISHAAFWDANRNAHDLNDLVPPNTGWEFEGANNIDEGGQILAWGNKGYALLTPATGAVRLSSNTLTLKDVSGSEVTGIVCDNLPNMPDSLVNRLTIPLPRELWGASVSVTVKNPVGGVKDADGALNTGTAVVQNGAIRYTPPDEFNTLQKPSSGSAGITLGAIRKVILSVSGTRPDGVRVVVDPKDVLLARPPIVLVHGINASPLTWKGFVRKTQAAQSVPIVAVDHRHPKNYNGDNYNFVPGGLFGGNAPVEVGAYLLSQRIQTTLRQVRNGETITDADQNLANLDPAVSEVNASDLYKGRKLAIRRVDVVAWSYGGVITRWYLASRGATTSQSWYKRTYSLNRADGTTISFANLPSTTFGNDVRKVITLGSMWRGVPLVNYLNEALFPLPGETHLGDAPLTVSLGHPLDNINAVVANLPIPTRVPSMEVMAINSRWLRTLVYGTDTPGSLTARPFQDSVAYGSVAGDSNAYISLPLVGDSLDPYTLISGAQQPSWFPYLALERRGFSPSNDSDGLVPLWSALLRSSNGASATVVPANHGNIVDADATIQYVIRWLNNASLPTGAALTTAWNGDIPSAGNRKTWTLRSGEMAPHLQNDLYIQRDGTGRLNPGALKELRAITISDINASGFTVRWKTAADMDSQVTLYRRSWIPGQKVFQRSVMTQALVKDHAMVLTGLTPQTWYYVTVESGVENAPDGRFVVRSPNTILVETPAASLKSARKSTLRAPVRAGKVPGKTGAGVRKRPRR